MTQERVRHERNPESQGTLFQEPRPLFWWGAHYALQGRVVSSITFLRATRWQSKEHTEMLNQVTFRTRKVINVGDCSVYLQPATGLWSHLEKGAPPNFAFNPTAHAKYLARLRLLGPSVLLMGIRTTRKVTE